MRAARERSRADCRSVAVLFFVLALAQTNLGTSMLTEGLGQILDLRTSVVAALIC